MLAVHTPSPEYPMLRNKDIDELADRHCYEIVTWPAYLPDEVCMDRLRRNTDPNVIMYVALMKGITPIVTIGDHKSFIADFSKKPKQRLPTFQTPSYNSIEQEEKHLRDQRGFE